MMKMNKTAVLLAVACSGLLAGCKPRDTVIDNGRMVIYHAEERKDQSLGKWEYWVRDNSTKGWTFISDQEMKVGETITVTVTR